VLAVLGRLEELQEKDKIAQRQKLLFAWLSVPSERNQDQNESPVPAQVWLARGCSPYQPGRYDIVQEWRGLIKPIS